MRPVTAVSIATVSGIILFCTLNDKNTSHAQAVVANRHPSKNHNEALRTDTSITTDPVIGNKDVESKSDDDMQATALRHNTLEFQADTGIRREIAGNEQELLTFPNKPHLAKQDQSDSHFGIHSQAISDDDNVELNRQENSEDKFSCHSVDGPNTDETCSSGNERIHEESYGNKAFNVEHEKRRLEARGVNPPPQPPPIVDDSLRGMMGISSKDAMMFLAILILMVAGNTLLVICILWAMETIDRRWFSSGDDDERT